jgi:hypothetical protein
MNVKSNSIANSKIDVFVHPVYLRLITTETLYCARTDVYNCLTDTEEQRFLTRVSTGQWNSLNLYPTNVENWVSS